MDNLINNPRWKYQMIEFNNIYKNYAEHSVLKGLSFHAHPGKVTGLVGPNGAGKSTSIRILTGFTDADKGTVKIDGVPMNIHSVQAKRLIGYAAENAPSYQEQTVYEYLKFIAQLRGVNKALLQNQLDRSINAFSLQSVCRQAIKFLSKGYRHRVCLAQCLLGDPPVIVLDEPTDGLDPIQKIETRKVITNLAQTKTVLLTTHLLEEVEELCDQVVAIHQGKLAFNGSMHDIKKGALTTEEITVKATDCEINKFRNALTELKAQFRIEYSDCTPLAAKLTPSSNLPMDGLNLVSFHFYQHKIRVIELKQNQPKLTSLLNIWTNQCAS